MIIKIRRVWLVNKLMNENYVKIMNVNGQNYQKSEKKDYFL